jgi:hypothetical protein
MRLETGYEIVSQCFFCSAVPLWQTNDMFNVKPYFVCTARWKNSSMAALMVYKWGQAQVYFTVSQIYLLGRTSRAGLLVCAK